MDIDARMELIRELCSFAGRFPGTDAERRAANFLAAQLSKEGRRAQVEPTYVHPQWALVHALHCALGVAGSLLALAAPVAGFAIVLIAATSMYLDANTRFYVLRRIFFRRASQNVLSSPRSSDSPARLIISAHYDAARTGYVFKNVRRLSRLDAVLPLPTGGFRPLFWSLALLLPVLGARMAGVEADWLSIVQLPPTLLLVIGVFLLVDIELSEVVPAANDNASGVATAISLAHELDADPPENLDVWVLLTGAEECLMQGMRSFLRAHRAQLDPKTTWTINLDSVGNGDVRFAVAEGPIVRYDLDRRLAELAQAIANADRDDRNRYRASPLAHEFATDALPARLAGLPATTITCLEPGQMLPARYHQLSDVPDHLDPEALERAHEFALELIRQLDRDLGRRGEAVNRTAPAGVDSA